MRAEINPGVDLRRLEEGAPSELRVAAQARDVARDRVALEDNACATNTGGADRGALSGGAGLRTLGRLEEGVLPDRVLPLELGRDVVLAQLERWQALQSGTRRISPRPQGCRPGRLSSPRLSALTIATPLYCAAISALYERKSPAWEKSFCAGGTNGGSSWRCSSGESRRLLRRLAAQKLFSHAGDHAPCSPCRLLPA